MSEIKEARYLESLNIWKQRIAQFKASGLTVRAFCQEIGCSPSTYYRWLHIVHAVAPDGDETADAAANSDAHGLQSKNEECHTAAAVNFVSFADLPVAAPHRQPSTAAPAPSCIRIHCGSMDMEILEGTPPGFLKSVLLSMQEVQASCS